MVMTIPSAVCSRYIFSLCMIVIGEGGIVNSFTLLSVFVSANESE